MAFEFPWGVILDPSSVFFEISGVNSGDWAADNFVLVVLSLFWETIESNQIRGLGCRNRIKSNVGANVGIEPNLI